MSDRSVQANKIRKCLMMLNEITASYDYERALPYARRLVDLLGGPEAFSGPLADVQEDRPDEFVQYYPVDAHERTLARGTTSRGNADEVARRNAGRLIAYDAAGQKHVLADYTTS